MPTEKTCQASIRSIMSDIYPVRTLTAALLHPIPADHAVPNHKRSPLDRLYQRFTDALDRLLRAVGLAFSPPVNANKILVDAL